MRLFLGLEVPLAIATELVAEARILAQSAALPHPRVSAPEQLHTALVFLGEVAETKLDAIRIQFSGIHADQVQLTLTHMDTFAQAGVLFAAVEPTPQLLELQAEAAMRMSLCGFPPEARRFIRM